MCDVATRQMVEDEIGDKVAKKHMFTAWDITRVVRQKGGSGRHGELKVVVHELFANGEMAGYDRSILRLPGANPPPFLYHPAGSDPGEYGPQGQAQAGGSAKKAVSIPDGDDDNDGAAATSEIDRDVGQEEVLYIPTSMVRAIGLDVGDKAAVAARKDGSLVVSKDSGTAQLVANYSVDVKGNVRLPKYVLPKHGGPFKIKLGTNEVTVA